MSDVAIGLRKQPVQARSQATCDIIIEATIQALLRDGTAGLTTTRVAKRAGVSVGTLYQYYSNKNALIEATQTRYLQMISHAVSEAVSTHKDADNVSLTRSILRALLDVKNENLAISHAILLNAEAPRSREFIRHARETFVELIGSLFADDLDKHGQGTREVYVAVAAIDGAMAFAVKERPAWLTQEWFLDQLVGLATAGLRISGPATY